MLLSLMITKFILAMKPVGPLAIATIDRTVQIGPAVLLLVTFEVGLAFEGFGPATARIGAHEAVGVMAPRRRCGAVAADSGKGVDPVRLIGYPV